jgi:hypothetical protein
MSFGPLRARESSDSASDSHPGVYTIQCVLGEIVVSSRRVNRLALPRHAFKVRVERNVTAVTHPGDQRYGSRDSPGASFDFGRGSKMREDARDLWEVQKFDEYEETIGSWLRAIIRRLKQQRLGAEIGQRRQPVSRRVGLRGTHC